MLGIAINKKNHPDWEAPEPEQDLNEELPEEPYDDGDDYDEDEARRIYG